MSFWISVAVIWFALGVASVLARIFGLTSCNWWLAWGPLLALLLVCLAVFAFFVWAWK